MGKIRFLLHLTEKERTELRNRIFQVSMDSASECLERCIDQNSVNGFRSISSYSSTSSCAQNSNGNKENHSSDKKYDLKFDIYFNSNT